MKGVGRRSARVASIMIKFSLWLLVPAVLSGCYVRHPSKELSSLRNANLAVERYRDETGSLPGGINDGALVKQLEAAGVIDSYLERHVKNGLIVDHRGNPLVYSPSGVETVSKGRGEGYFYSVGANGVDDKGQLDDYAP